MKKRIYTRACSVLLALSMVLTTAAPVWAAGETADTGTYSVTLNDTEKTLTLGTDGTLTATLVPPSPPSESGDGEQTEGGGLAPQADPPAVDWSWTSDDPTVLKVTEDTTDGSKATLHPVAVVKDKTVLVTVTAEVTPVGGTAQTVSASCAVIVTYAPATDLILAPTQVSLDPKERTTVTANLVPRETTDPTNVEWSWKEEQGFATLSAGTGQKVEVIGVKAGLATLVAKSGDVTKELNVEVKGIQLKKGEEFADALRLKTGEEAQLTASVIGLGEGNVVSWTSNNPGVAMVDKFGKVTAQTVGKTWISASVGNYSASCEVTVVENTADVIPKQETTVSAGQPYYLVNLQGEMEELCNRQLKDTELAYISNLTVPTDQGILHYRYVSPDDPGMGVGSTENYYCTPGAGQRALADVVFIPNPDFNGTATIRYSGYNSGRQFFTGRIKLNVAGGTDVMYSADDQIPASFKASDFSSVCKQKTGRDLDYVTFELPAASKGTLYYQYGVSGLYNEKVSGDTKYYRNGTPSLDNVIFVPADNYTGTVEIGYRGTNTAGSGYNGEVTVIVSRRNETGTGDVTYTSSHREKVTFVSSDFNEVCRAITGSTLDYVKFTLPESGQGTLYYNYRSNGGYDSKVSASTKYYRASNPSISNVTFLPGDSATGTVEIDFTGYSIEGERFDGRVRVEVTGGGGLGEVWYSGKSGQPVKLYASDFNEACLTANDETLKYVQFDLPSTSQGTLYYRYQSGSSTGSKASAGTKYYRSGSPSISDLTFVPARGYSGTVRMDFTGYDTTNHRFDGTLYIEVTDGGDQTVRYSLVSGGAAVFSEVDFDSVCRSITGSGLNYVRFTLPTSSQGILYYDYDRQTGKYNSKVNASSSYYRSGSSRLLDKVTFVADKRYTGTLYLAYTGWSTSNEKFEGTVELRVTAPVAQTIRYTGSSMPISFKAADFNNVCRTLTGRELVSISFNSLPTSRQGQLWVNYYGPNQPGTPVNTGSSYYVDGSPKLGQISLVARSGFQGTVSLSYTGTDTMGEQFNGTVECVLSNSYSASRFTDLGSYSWARPSVEFLYQFGVVNGVYGTQYGPGNSIRRGDFTLMLCKAFQFDGGSTYSFPDVSNSSYYAGAVATAKELGIVSGNEQGRFQPEGALTRQDAMVMLRKAMVAAGKSGGDGSASVLNAYADGDQVAGYAREAVAAMVQMGVVSGDNSRRLNPRASLTRAEMAVILHQVLTL